MNRSDDMKAKFVSGFLLASLSLLSQACSGSASGTNSHQCIDVTLDGWEQQFVSHFGERGCVVGPLFAGADGVFLVTNPPAGPPPYGQLISVDIPKNDAAAGRKQADRTKVFGTLLGRKFCERNLSSAGCDQTDATFFRYYVYRASLADAGSVSSE